MRGRVARGRGHRRSGSRRRSHAILTDTTSTDPPDDHRSRCKEDIRKLQRAIVDGLEDVKAQDIVVFNTEHLSPLFERVIVASGTSQPADQGAGRQRARRGASEAGFPKPRTEGEDNGEWIIVDCGAAVAHIMQPAIRAVLPPRGDLGRQAGADEARRGQAGQPRRRRAPAKKRAGAPGRRRSRSRASKPAREEGARRRQAGCEEGTGQAAAAEDASRAPAQERRREQGHGEEHGGASAARRPRSAPRSEARPRARAEGRRQAAADA